jgi:hypothetical protein
MRGIERIEFENGHLWINHTAYPLRLASTEGWTTYGFHDGSHLIPRQAVFIRK